MRTAHTLSVFLFITFLFNSMAFSTMPEPNGKRDLTPEKPGRCLLVVKGKTYISGSCKIEMDTDGSFRIYEKRTPGYFAYVNMSDDGAEGFWNGSRSSTHAHDPLGTLTRKGACWSNATAKVCAWQ